MRDAIVFAGLLIAALITLPLWSYNADWGITPFVIVNFILLNFGVFRAARWLGEILQARQTEN